MKHTLRPDDEILSDYYTRTKKVEDSIKVQQGPSEIESLDNFWSANTKNGLFQLPQIQKLTVSPGAPSIPTPPVNMANYHTTDLATEQDDEEVINKIIQAGYDTGTIIPKASRLVNMTPDQISALPDSNLSPIDRFKQAWKYGEGRQLVDEGYGEKWSNEGQGGEDLINQGQKEMLSTQGVMKYAHQMKDTEGFVEGAKEWGRALADPNYWLVNQAMSLPSNWDIAKKQLVAGIAGNLLVASGAGAPVGAGIQAAGVAAATHTEAVMEAEGVYAQIFDEEKRKGVTVEAAHEKANKAANETYTKNIAILAPTNALQQLSVFGVGAGLLKKASMIAKASPAIQTAAKGIVATADAVGPVATGVAKETGRLALTAGSEGAQEGLQYIASQTSMDKDWDFGKDFQENVLGGVAMGGGVQIAGRGASALINRSNAPETPAIPPVDTEVPSIFHLTSPEPEDTTFRAAQEEAEQTGAGILTPQISSTSEPQGDLGLGRLPDSTTATPDLVAGHVQQGLDKDESYNQLSLERGGNPIMSQDEHSFLYDEIKDSGYTPESIDVNPVDIDLPKSAVEPVVESINTPVEETKVEPTPRVVEPAIGVSTRRSKAPTVRSEVEAKFGVKLSEDSFRISDQTPENNASVGLASKLAKAVGYNLMVVDPTNDEADKFNGFINREHKTIVLSSKASNPIHTVMYHELGHAMMYANKQIHDAWKSTIKEVAGKGIENRYNDRRKVDSPEWKGLTPEQQDAYINEFMSDSLQQVSTRDNFYKRLMARSPEAARTFLKTLSDLVKKLKGLKVDEDYEISKYISDIEAWEKSCAKAMREYLAYETSNKKITPKINVPEPKGTIVKSKSQEEREKVTGKEEKHEDPTYKAPSSGKGKKHVSKSPTVKVVVPATKIEEKKIPTPKVESKLDQLQKSVDEAKKGIQVIEDKPKIKTRSFELSDEELHNKLKDSLEEQDASTYNLIIDELERRQKEYEKSISKTTKVKTVKVEDLNRKKTREGNEDISAYEMEATKLTNEEQRELGRKAQAGDKEALRKLISSFQKLIYGKAYKYAKNAHNLDPEDLVSVGQISLIETIMGSKNKKGEWVMHYDPNRAEPLYGTAELRMRGDILRYMNTYGSMIRTPEEQKTIYGIYLRARAEILEEMGATHKEEISPVVDIDIMDDILDKMRNIGIKTTENLSMNRLLDIIKNQETVSSLNLPVGEDGAEVSNFIADPNAIDPDKDILTQQLEETLGNAIKDLDKIQKETIYYRFFYNGPENEYGLSGLGLSLNKIGEKLGVSKTVIAKREKKALEILRNSEAFAGKDAGDYRNGRPIESLFSEKLGKSISSGYFQAVQNLYDAVDEARSLFSEKLTPRGFLKSTADLFSDELNKSVLEDSKALYKPETFDGWINFAKGEIEKGLDKAVKRFNKDNFEPGQKTVLGLYLSTALDEKARELHEAGDYNGSMRAMSLAKDVIMETAATLTMAGQEVAAARLAEKFHAPNITAKLQRETDEVFEKLHSKIKTKIRKHAKDVKEGMSSINTEVVNEVIDELSNDNIINFLTTPVDENPVPSKETVDITMSKIEEHYNKNEGKDTPIKRVVKIMNDMFKSWFSEKPNNHKPNKEFTEDIIKKFVSNDESIREAWDEISSKLRMDYGEVFKTPQDFFNYHLSLPSTEAGINRRIHETLKMMGTNLNNVVTEQDVRELVKSITTITQTPYNPAFVARVKYLVQENKKDAAERLAKRIVNMASVKEGKEEKPNNIRDMMNMITKIAREELPKQISKPKDPMDMVIQAMINQREYQKLWMASERHIMEEYPEFKDEIATLQQFFNRPINDIVANSQMDRVLRKGLTESDLTIESIIKKHYTEQTLAIQSLTDKLLEANGDAKLKTEDIIKLADRIETRFNELAEEKKRKMLERIFAEYKPKTTKKLIDRILEYSNLGAFSEEQYRSAICDKLGLPTVTPEVAMTISKLCDRIQTIEYRREPSIDEKHEIRYSTTYKLMLMTKDSNGEFQEVGRYNTIDEAKEHAPEGTEWRGYTNTVGSILKDELVMELNFVLASHKKPSWLRMVSTYQTIAMLLNVATFSRNVIGNELTYWANRVSKLLSVPFDIARCKFTGADRTITFSKNNSLTSYFDGLVYGGRAAWKGWTPRNLQGQYEIGFAPTFPRDGNFFQKGMSFLEATMRVSLLGMDQAASTRAYNDMLSELAILKCINNKEKVNKENVNRYTATADKNMNDQCVEFLKKMTYQNDNTLTKAASSVKQFLNAYKEFGLGDIVMKFTKVPMNLTVLAFEYSPFGFIKGMTIAIKNMKEIESEKNTRGMIEAFSQAAVGTIGFTGFGLWMAMLGIMTGQEDKDERKKIKNRAQGGGLYKINLSAFRRYALSLGDSKQVDWRDNDLIMGYSWAEPIATSAAIGVGIADTWKNIKSARKAGTPMTVSEIVIDGLKATISGLGTIMDRSVFDGVKTLFEVPPGGSLTGDQMIMNAGQQLLINGPASFIPATLRQGRNYSDPYSRTTWTDDSTVTMMNKIKDKLPGYSETLPAQQDYFGNPMEKNVGMEGNIFSSFISPAYVNKFKLPSGTEQVVDKVYEESGDPKSLPGAMGRSVTIKGENIKLTDIEVKKLGVLRGQEIDKLIQKSTILNNPNKKTETKVDRLHDIYGEAGTKARKLILPEVKKSRGI